MITLLERTHIISTTLKAAGATALMYAPFVSHAGAFFGDSKEYTVQNVIDIILKEIPGAPFKQTVDTIKSGDAGQKVTGIVTTMFTTVKVIEEAARLGANFVIAHEPTFYNHTDDLNWVLQNQVVKQKQDLLQQHGIAVWRFHDYWHTYRPDGITHGVLKKAGWLDYYKQGDPILELPPAPLKKIAEHLKSSRKIAHVRVIGNLDQVCSRAALLPGAAGGQRQVSLAEKQHPDVLIVGELSEWETAEYIRDARLLGAKTSLIVLGHSVSEEPGMEWLVEWLQPKVPGLTITHIPSNDPFTWL
jgi:putative NIF3 family GTP cyclohydrolase 1 type 2